MHAEIIAVGDEITSGQLLDSNSQWLSLRLEELGVRVLYHTTVGDELDPAAEVFRQAIGRSDLVIVTGGLGPTADDLTREAVAQATGRELRSDPEALEHVRRIFARLNRPMPERNQRQALIPDGGRMIHNPNGTAPGIDLEIPREGTGPARLFALPGVPAEMKEIWDDSLAEELGKVAGGQGVVRHRRIKCFGAGESQVEAMLPDLIRRGREPRVGINASQTTIILRITAAGPTEEACFAAMEPTIATIRECLGKLIYGQDDDELQDVVIRLLRQRGATLATVEWGTTGLVAQWLDGVAGAEGFYRGGLVTADESVLQSVLEVPAGLLIDDSAEDGELVRTMALGCRRRFAADYGLAIGRFPRPSADVASPPSVSIALAGPEGVDLKRFPHAGHPATLKTLCAKRAMNLVRLTLR